MSDQNPPSPTAIIAPLSGELVPLEMVPDPVFAQRMVGDGVAIDPLDQILRAPCDGVVAQLHPAGHAVTLRTEDGVEILMHIGLDTVEMKGGGFTPRVKEGDRVSTGAPLVEFDLDFLAMRVKSMLTLIVVSHGGKAGSLATHSGLVRAGEDTIFTFVAEESARSETSKIEAQVTSEMFSIPNPNGLHARPAAVLASAARAFRSEIRLQLGERHANAKSVTSILALDVRHGANVCLVAQGIDGEEAVAHLGELLRGGLGDEGGTPAPAAAAVARPALIGTVARVASEEDANLLQGAAASPGLGVGAVFQVRHAQIAVLENAEHPEAERRQLGAAIEKAKGQLSALQAQLRVGKDPARAAIFAAHTELLEDPELLEIASAAIAKGRSAAFSWQQTFQLHAARLAEMPNELLAQRANDLRDVGERVLQLLTGIERAKPNFPPDAVLIAEDLTPSDAAALDRARVIGFCTVRGGATSHVSILARAFGIPAVAGIAPRALEIANGTQVILDGGRGLLRLNPSAYEMEQLRRLQEGGEAKRKQDLAHAAEPAVTRDGARVEVAANIGGLREAEEIAALGGEGVGLLRSEFLFLDRASAPSEDEQFKAYKAIAQAVGPEHPLIVRTLDVGGDKPLAYLPIPAEENPFLGERGIRAGLDRPEFLRTQIRAILRASLFGKIQIMFPMISTLDELRAARAIVQEEAARLEVPPVPLGIMVEVPAVAIMATQFAQEADFFSIGTNDLAQYTLAMDRGHPKLAPQVDGLNPAVLRLIAQSAAAAHAVGKWIGVCGGIAADAHAVPILVGLGIEELSVSLPAIPAVKAQIRALDRASCRKLAERALDCGTAAEVRALASEFAAASASAL